MDVLTFVIAILVVAILIQTGLAWLSHVDAAGMMIRMDRSLEKMDRSLEHMDHAVERMDQSTAACNRAADACQSTADAMRLLVQQQVMRDRPQPGPAE